MKNFMGWGRVGDQKNKIRCQQISLQTNLHITLDGTGDIHPPYLRTPGQNYTLTVGSPTP